jgi:hypothetical protein
MNNFVIIPADNFIWNRNELIKFLVDNQGASIILTTNNEGCCLNAVGLYDLLDNFKFEQVIIYTKNPIEYNEKYQIRNNKCNIVPYFFEAEGDFSQYHHWDKQYIFGALYNRAIWHRIGLVGELQTECRENSLIHFRSNPHDEDSRALFEMQRLFEFSPSSVTKFLNVMPQLPMLLTDLEEFTLGLTTQRLANQFKQFYTEFLIDIVAETFTTGRTFFPTEKTTRPMLMKKPFIVMGSKHFLTYLRQMGFKTFHDFWDESYDVFDEKQRYEKILDLITTISHKSLDELGSMYDQMQKILDHNHDLIMDKQFNKKITYVE